MPKAARSARLSGSFDPQAMLQLDEIPSWQPGFSFQRLDRLVLWAEMVGLITSAGRLAEWSKPLISDHPPFLPHAEEFPNPFLLSRRERAYFLALLMYHDQPDHYVHELLTETLWPDFSRQDLVDAIDEYNRRQRRYGGV